MFKIVELSLIDKQNKKYTYKFSSGVNFFKGKNSSGKTVFYNILDYMFGATQNLSTSEWFKDLKEFSMIVEMDAEKQFTLIRTINPEINYISNNKNEFQNTYPISKDAYVSRISRFFTSKPEILEQIKNFTGEDLTFRTFSMFNFLGENGQGLIRDFFDKCSDIKYSVRLNSVLNFIFNSNQEEISKLENKLEEMLKEVEKLEYKTNKYEFVKKEINRNIRILKLNIEYNGKNTSEIKERLEKLKTFVSTSQKTKTKSLSELEDMYNNIDEQIKIYDISQKDCKKWENENNNRKYLLNKLNEIILENSSLDYLIKPIENLIKELDSTVAFGKYIIETETINKLKKQRKLLKEEIEKYTENYEIYNIEQKQKAFILLETYLSENCNDYSEELQKKRELIKKYKARIRELQNEDDLKKIEEISNYITKLYFSATKTSSFVKEDSLKNGFKIKYIKRGNILQPIINKETKENVNYEIGSKARQTLIQLCGYFSFLKILVKNSKYPIMPLFIGDHLSQSFDTENAKAIGSIINQAVKDIGENNIQIFLFDDESAEALNIEANNTDCLYKEDDKGNILQTGFVPFYFPIK